MGVRREYDWRKIQEFIDLGNGYVACHRRFGIWHATWMAAIRRGDLRFSPQSSAYQDRRYVHDWAAVQAYYDEGHSFRETQRKFGFSSGAWHKAKNRGDLVPRKASMTIEDLLRRGVSRYNVKVRLLRAGLLRNVCYICGLTEWRGIALNMHLDHINGIKNDHRLENLRMLCPNCHSQTETYGGKNMKRRRRLQGAASLV